jgi:hypothetical protein
MLHVHIPNNPLQESKTTSQAGQVVKLVIHAYICQALTVSGTARHASGSSSSDSSSSAHLCHLMAQLEGCTLETHVTTWADLQDEPEVDVHDVALVV